MKQWYRKTVAKVILVILAILSGAACVTGLASSMSLAGTANPSEIWKMTKQTYEESQDFNGVVENLVAEIMNRIRLENLFETDGAYNPNKLVDIMEYSGNGTITGSNTSGVAYTLEELENWSEDFQTNESDIYDDNGVVVCEKPDGTYYYYYLNDFLLLFENGELSMQFDEDSEQRQKDYLDELEKGNMTSSGSYDFWITDTEGKVEYTDCWNFGSSLREKYAPDGAENLLQAINENPQLNGKLSIIYDDIASVLSGLYNDMNTYQDGWDYLEEGNTNLTYLYVNQDTKRVVTNKSSYEKYDDVWQNIKEMTQHDSVKYMIVYPQLKDFDTNMNISASSEWDLIRSYVNERTFNRILAIAVDTSYPIQDQFYEGQAIYKENVPILRNSLILAGAVGILFLIATVYLTVAAGRKAGDSELYLGSFDRWKTEIAAAVIIVIFCVGTIGFTSMGTFNFDGWSNDVYAESMSYYGGTVEYARLPYMITAFTRAFSMLELLAVFAWMVFAFGCFFAGYLSLVKRIKAKTLWQNSVLRMVIMFCGEIISERSVTSKAVLLTGCFMIIEWLAVISANLFVVFLMLVMDIVVIYVVISSAIAKNRLKKGIEEIASGNMSYQIPLKGLRGSNRNLAEKVNDIGEGLNRAVEEGMKNERLKTDLITNVSHDIKTPLTSIINYVDILKRSGIDDPKIQGYLDILESKAQRLKTLTEDVVEASKVSSGNITLECMDMNLTELVQQTEGEFAEKFEARDLTMVVNLPEEPAVVHVDGRRMWRVLENIFGNAAKYAMPGTRVYADLTVSGNYVNFSLKNVSEQQLNISADELTERFIRGDISRSTEGSGLGLSIAKSLTEMQGGQFELYLDGDLFRVNICFERVR